MWMSILKIEPKLNLYYSDTDNAVVDAPLPPSLVGPELGKVKLEYTINRAVFLAPKVYGFVDVEGNEVIKVKGLSKEELSDIHVRDLELLLLLIKDSSKELNQEKWYKKVFEGEINVNEVAYTLKSTSNKREPIYINDVYSNTEPYNYDEISNKNNNNEAHSFLFNP